MIVWPGSNGTSRAVERERRRRSSRCSFGRFGEVGAGVVAAGHLRALRRARRRGRRPGSKSSDVQPPLVGAAGTSSACRAAGCRRCGRGRSGWSPAAPGRCSTDLVEVVAACRGRRRSCPCSSCSSVVPTRQGVQKPQLSCAKKCAKLRATSNMSRLPVEDHERAGGRHVLEGDAAAELGRRRGRRPTGRRPAPPACRRRRSPRAPRATVTPNGYS